MTQSIYVLQDAPLISQKMNERFSDMLGGSILSGFRVAAGTNSTKVSLVKGGDAQSVVVTWGGVRIVEDGDLVDILTLLANSTGTDRLDSVYVFYTHGDKNAVATYVVAKGNADGSAAAELPRANYTFLGHVLVPANGGSMSAGCYRPKSHGLDRLEFARSGVVHGDLVLDGALDPANKSGTRDNLQVYSQAETDALVGNATRQFVFTQSTPSASWSIVHGLHRYPAVNIVDNNELGVWADIRYDSDVKVTITFSTAFSGKAYLY